MKTIYQINEAAISRKQAKIESSLDESHAAFDEGNFLDAIDIAKVAIIQIEQLRRDLKDVNGFFHAGFDILRLWLNGAEAEAKETIEDVNQSHIDAFGVAI